MNGTTTRTVVDDILVSLKQTFDDKDITRAQVAYWVIIAGNDLLSKHIVKRNHGLFLNIFPDVPVTVVKENKGGNIIKNRKFVELPAQIFSFDRDGAVNYVAYESTGGEGCPPRFTNVQLTRTSQKESRWLYKSVYTTPSPTNPYFYLAGNVVYFLGIEKVPVESVEMGLMTTINPVEKIDIDQPFPFPAELLGTIKRMVTDLAKYSFLVQADDTNDGKITTNQTPNIPKIQSVNAQQEE